jgi:hypothetical protein
MNRNNLFWGLFLIVIGSLFLVNTLGIFSFNVWELVWPGFLIALGVWTIWATRPGQAKADMEAIAIPLDEGVSRAQVLVRYGGGRIRLGGTSQAGTLVSGSFSGGLNIDNRKAGDRQKLELRAPSTISPVVFMPWAWGPRDWDFSLGAGIPLSLEVASGGSDAQLVLTDLQLTELSLETGASTIDVYLPVAAGHTQVKVNGGVMTVNIQVPEAVSARIKITGALKSTSIDTDRFPRSGGMYASENYDTAENRADIEVEMGVGTVHIY